MKLHFREKAKNNQDAITKPEGGAMLVAIKAREWGAKGKFLSRVPSEGGANQKQNPLADKGKRANNADSSRDEMGLAFVGNNS